MRYYRRGVHSKPADSLTIHKVLCKVLPQGHLTLDRQHFCYHNLRIAVPPYTATAYIRVRQSPTQFPALL